MLFGYNFSLSYVFNSTEEGGGGERKRVNFRGGDGGVVYGNIKQSKCEENRF